MAFQTRRDGQPSPRGTFTVRVPTDYATLQDAVEAHVNSRLRNASRVIVLIESGYEIPTGVTRSDPADQMVDEPVVLWVEGCDASHIWIRSESATVAVADGFEGSIIRNIRASGVVLDARINMRSLGGGAVGYSAEYGSRGHVEPGAGVVNAPNRGLWVRQVSIVYAAFGVDFSGAGSGGGVGGGAHRNRAADINHGSIAYIRDGDFSGSGGIGLRTRACVYVDAESADFSGAAEEAARLEQGGTFQLRNADLRDSESGLLANDAVLANANGATISGCTLDAIAAHNASYVSAVEANLSNSRRSIAATGGSVVAARSSNCSGATYTGDQAGRAAVAGGTLATIDVREADITNSASSGVHAFSGARVLADDADASGAAEHGILALGDTRGGGTVYAAGANAQKTASPSEDDIAVSGGGAVHARGAIGGLSQTPNILTPDGTILNAQVTRNSGTSSISGTSTHADVNHGLDVTPSIEHIRVTPSSELENAARFWISDAGASTFRINVDAAPGEGNSDSFAWGVVVE